MKPQQEIMVHLMLSSRWKLEKWQTPVPTTLWSTSIVWLLDQWTLLLSNNKQLDRDVSFLITSVWLEALHNPFIEMMCVWFSFFFQINTQSKGKTGKARQHTQTHDLLFFQKRLEDRIQLFENSKQRESSVRNKVKYRTQKPWAVSV